MSGCGKAKEVPDTIIDWAVQDYLEQNKNYGGDYSGYDATIVHAPDKETNTDSVTVNLTINYPYLVASSQYEATYKYDKSGDWWDVIRGGKWSPIKFDKTNLSTSMEIWENAFREFSGARPSITQEIVFANEKDWEGMIKTTGLSLEAFKEGWSFVVENNGVGVINCVTVVRQDNAEQLYNSWYTYYFDFYGISSPQKQGKGKNYQYSFFTTAGLINGIIIRQDNSVFLISYDSSVDYYEYLLGEMGMASFIS